MFKKTQYLMCNILATINVKTGQNVDILVFEMFLTVRAVTVTEGRIEFKFAFLSQLRCEFEFSSYFFLYAISTYIHYSD